MPGAISGGAIYADFVPAMDIVYDGRVVLWPSILVFAGTPIAVIAWGRPAGRMAGWPAGGSPLRRNHRGMAGLRWFGFPGDPAAME